jgi:hypothetical protein
MFGAMEEAKARCGHFVVWDVKAEQTRHWSTRSVESAPCPQCQIDELKSAVESLRKLANPW